jgi:hypothetical protein
LTDTCTATERESFLNSFVRSLETCDADKKSKLLNELAAGAKAA